MTTYYYLFQRRFRYWLAGGVLLSAVSQGAVAVEISIACGGGGEGDYCPIAARAWAEETGHSVNIVSTPNGTTEKLALFQQLLNSRSSDVDVMMIDLAWPGLLAPHLVDLNDYLADSSAAEFFPALIAANTVAGRLVALPWYTDAGLLYYRADLLEKHGRPVPTTWAEMTETARLIQQKEREAGHAGIWGYVFQGRAYEGLTCNALEWIASYGGGQIVAEDGSVTVDNPLAVQALSDAAGWIDTIAPQGVLNYTEEEARGIFQTGNAVFMRNWPYAWALAQEEGSTVRGAIGVAPLPHGPQGTSISTLGGWNFAVSRYSEHPEPAAELAIYLTGAKVQRQHALNHGMNPTRPALYQDQQVLAANPTMDVLRPVLQNALPRPVTVTRDQYARVSNEVFNTAHSVLSGSTEAAPALESLSQRLERLRRQQW